MGQAVLVKGIAADQPNIGRSIYWGVKLIFFKTTTKLFPVVYDKTFSVMLLSLVYSKKKVFENINDFYLNKTGMDRFQDCCKA